ncbi:Mobile element protein [Richelia intracellularis]|nr:Mobile element protein [Richelia intracellularis]
MVLYDVRSTYLAGKACPLAKYGYNREKKRGKLQIVFGLLCNDKACAIAV